MSEKPGRFNGRWRGFEVARIGSEIGGLLAALPPRRPVLIAGPTASGKSALALEIAERAGGVIVNADASQVFQGWPILTAQPGAEDLVRAPHRLYGHLPFDAPYSVGDWLRELRGILSGDERAIIVGGTGLNLSALTEGLAEIPPVPGEVRREADAMDLAALTRGLDEASRARLDLSNRARVQRAWEVLRATGRGIADWQDRTPPPLLPLTDTLPLVLDAPKEWLTPRIARRFDLMLEAGALAEAEAMEPRWDPALLSSRAIGAAEMITVVRGEMTLDAAREAIVTATRQYAKRQRTWFRRRMADWRIVPCFSTE